MTSERRNCCSCQFYYSIYKYIPHNSIKGLANKHEEIDEILNGQDKVAGQYQLVNLNIESSGNIMFTCCEEKKTELDIIENVESCEIHGDPFVFICLNQARQCAERPLLCLKCLEKHKGHDWESIAKYFTADFKKSLERGTSKNGGQVSRMAEVIDVQYERLRIKINKKIDEMQYEARQEMKKLVKKYPIKDKFGITGRSLSNNNAHQIIQIVNREQENGWIQATEEYYTSLVSEVSSMVSNLFYDLSENLDGIVWESLTMQKVEEDVMEFIKKYEGMIDNEKHYFKFSEHEKNPGIRISPEGLEAKYMNSKPSKPAVIIGKKMTNQHNTVYFKMTKMQSKALIFEATLVAIGVCIPKTVKSYGYRNIIEPSHGAYLMGSNGRCYHSSLPEYEKKDIGFSFSESDIVAVSINFREKIVSFSKKSFFNKYFQMELMIKDEDMENLRPCLMFYGEEGAIVEIVEEDDLQKKKGKKK